MADAATAEIGENRLLKLSNPTKDTAKPLIGSIHRYPHQLRSIQPKGDIGFPMGQQAQVAGLAIGILALKMGLERLL